MLVFHCSRVSEGSAFHCLTLSTSNICFMIQKGRNALRNETKRWKFPIPYILGDDLGEFVLTISIFEELSHPVMSDAL